MLFFLIVFFDRREAGRAENELGFRDRGRAAKRWNLESVTGTLGATYTDSPIFALLAAKTKTDVIDVFLARK